MQNYDDPEIINVGTGEGCTIRELAELVREITRYRGEMVFDTSMPDGMPHKVLDVSRLKALGWRPSIPLREGIVSTPQWYCSNLG